MEELRLSLDTYKLQLQQVEAALTADATSEELLKLKQDLVEVIALTNELISAQRETEDDSKNKSGERGSHKRNIQWSIGDKCMVGIILDIMLARNLHYILFFFSRHLGATTVNTMIALLKPCLQMEKFQFVLMPTVIQMSQQLTN